MSIQHLSTPITTGFGTTKYDTGWIANSDWTAQKLGSAAGADLIHNLRSTLDKLEVLLLLSETGNDADATKAVGPAIDTSSANGNIGFRVAYTDDDTITIVTGSNGLLKFNSGGTGTILGAASAWYYRVIVEIRRPTFVWIPDSWLPPTMIVEDVKAYNVAGGTFTLGADRTRDLNTVRYNTIPGASLAANQITLPPGTYEAEWSCPAYRVSRHWSRLWDTTGPGMLIMGSVMYADNNYNGENVSLGRGVLTLSIESVLELRHRCITTVTTEGLGVATNTSGYNNVYTQIKLVRKDT